MRSSPPPHVPPPGRARLALGALAVLLGVAAVVAAARGRAPAAHAGPVAVPDLPLHLADTGLYEDFGARRVAADVLPYTPQYPLWTDGAHKRRWIRLPAGSSIDASDPDAWDFPVGTRLWKEFGFDRPIETRTIERLPDGSWRFATYLWTEDGPDAVLAPERGVRAAAESRPGVPYDVPGRADCAVCHGHRATPVLGFGALQLSPDRDPLAPHAEAPAPDDVDLVALARRGLLRGLPSDPVTSPPRIDAPTARGRAALGYLHANCGTCHTSAGPLAGLDLRLDVRLAPVREGGDVWSTAVGRESRWRPSGAAAPPPLRVAPGDPGRTALLLRAASRLPLVQMPPLGTHVVDGDGVALLDAWVREDLAPTASHVPPQPLPENPR